MRVNADDAEVERTCEVDEGKAVRLGWFRGRSGVSGGRQRQRKRHKWAVWCFNLRTGQATQIDMDGAVQTGAQVGVMQVVAGGWSSRGEARSRRQRGAAGDDREGAERGGERPWQARRAHGQKGGIEGSFAGVSMQAHAAEGEEKQRRALEEVVLT